MEHNEQGRDEFVRLGFTDFFWVERPKWKAHTPREVFTATVGGINLEIFRTLHIPDRSLTFDTSFVSYGLYLPDEKVLFSADSKFDPTMFEMYSDAEVIYHDCQNFVGGVQASLEELKSLPQEIKNKMYLTHYSDDFQKWDISDFAGFAEQGVIYSF